MDVVVLLILHFLNFPKLVFGPLHRGDHTAFLLLGFRIDLIRNHEAWGPLIVRRHLQKGLHVVRVGVLCVVLLMSSEGVGIAPIVVDCASKIFFKAI